MMKTAVIWFLLSATSILAAASSLEPIDIINREGSLNISDGSSIYTFDKNGTFSLQPLGISGRTVAGHWRYQSPVFKILGKWSWINGFSPENDYRTMKLIIYAAASNQKRTVGLANTPVYNCYFFIEELDKTPPVPH